MSISDVIVWLVVGALAGSIVGGLVARKKEGLGRWTNLGVGLVGALIGGALFRVFKIDLGTGVVISLDDVIAAICGSLLFIVVWWLVRKKMGKGKEAQPDRS